VLRFTTTIDKSSTNLFRTHGPERCENRHTYGKVYLSIDSGVRAWTDTVRVIVESDYRGDQKPLAIYLSNPRTIREKNPDGESDRILFSVHGYVGPFLDLARVSNLLTFTVTFYDGAPLAAGASRPITESPSDVRIFVSPTAGC
jgi:hypothetical protein